jgi:hypothetical protein
MVGLLSEVRYKSASAGESTRAEVKMYEASLDRAAKVLSDLVRLNIEDRLIRVSAAQTALVSGAIEGALTELAPMLDGYDAHEVHLVVAKHLRLCQIEDKATAS